MKNITIVKKNATAAIIDNFPELKDEIKPVIVNAISKKGLEFLDTVSVLEILKLVALDEDGEGYYQIPTSGSSAPSDAVPSIAPTVDKVEDTEPEFDGKISNTEAIAIARAKAEAKAKEPGIFNQFKIELTPVRDKWFEKTDPTKEPTKVCIRARAIAADFKNHTYITRDTLYSYFEKKFGYTPAQCSTAVHSLQGTVLLGHSKSKAPINPDGSALSDAQLKLFG